MNIAGLTAFGGLPPTGGPSLLRGASNSPGSSFGPSARLGGSTRDFTQGLYNSLGALLGAGKTPANPGKDSPQARRRAEILNEAATLIDLGDSAGGRALAQGLLKKNSRDVTALRLVGHSFLNERDYKQAERSYGQALAFAPDNPTLQGELNTARTLQKSDDEVLKQGRRLIQAPTRRAEGLQLLARLTDRSPNNTEAFLALAEGSDASRNPLQVIGALQEAVKTADPQQIQIVIDRARSLVEQHAEVGLAHNLLGRALQKAGQFREGLAELKRAADIAPFNFSYGEDYANGILDRALNKLSRGDLVSARVDAQTAQSLAPSNARLADVTARIASEQARKDVLGGQFTKALVQLNIAFNKAPDDAQFKKQLSSQLLRLGGRFLTQSDPSSALSAYIKAYDLTPDSATARRNVAQLSNSEGLKALNSLSYDSAITHLERAYAADRNNQTYKTDLAGALDQRGALNLSIGKIDEAITDLERGLLLDPTNSSLSANYAAALAKQTTT